MQDLSGSWHRNEDLPAGPQCCAEALMIPTLVSNFPAPMLAPIAVPEMHNDCTALNKPELWVQEGAC